MIHAKWYMVHEKHQHNPEKLTQKLKEVVSSSGFLRNFVSN